MLRAALLLLLPATALADDAGLTDDGWVLGATIDPSVIVDVTPDGLGAVSSMIPVLLPEQIDVPDMYESGTGWRFYLTDAWVGIAVESAHLTPRHGAIDLEAHARVWVNNSADQFNMRLQFWTFGWWTAANCDTYIRPFDLFMNSSLGLHVDHELDPPQLDATLAPIDWHWDVTNDHVELDCWVGGLDDFLSWFGFSPIQMVLDYAAGEIDDMVQDMRPEIEEMIEELFSAASLEQEIPIGDAVLNVKVHPSDVQITPDGVRVAAAGSFDTEAHACVAEYGHVGSKHTNGEPPAIGTAPAGVPSPYHLGVAVDDDFVNQGLFAAYQGGLLCFNMTEDDGLPINTTLLGILSSEAFGELFPSSQPMVIQTRPAEPPVASAVGPHDLNLDVQDLGIDFYAELDYRMALIVGADLATEAGIDLGFDGTTGDLEVDVAFSTKDIEVTIRRNEFAPGYDEQLVERFATLFDVVVDPLLGDALAGFGFAMPSMEGFGLQWAQAAGTGEGGEWIGLYGGVGPVAYDNGGGCGEDSEGCDTGCGTGAIPARTLLFVVPLLVATLRRRQRSA